MNGRNYIDFALLQPGVANFNEKDNGAGSSNRGTKLNINGMSFRSNSFLLDGANMRSYPGDGDGSAAGTDPRPGNDSGIPRRNQRVFGRLRPRHGRRFSLVTEERHKTTVHGSGFEFFRDSALDARDFFDRGAGLRPSAGISLAAALGAQFRKTGCSSSAVSNDCRRTWLPRRPRSCPLTSPVPGHLVAISPAVRPYLDLYPRANAGDVGVNTGIGVFSFERNQPTRETFYQGRFDYTLSVKDSVFVRYTNDGANQDGHLLGSRLHHQRDVEEPILHV